MVSVARKQNKQHNREDELLPKWRLQLLALVEEALSQIKKERKTSIRRSSLKPCPEARNPCAAEVRSSR